MQTDKQWLSYSFDGVKYGKKLSREGNFELHIDKSYSPKVMNYYEALNYNAMVMRDNFQEPFDVLLSGGIDSEVIVRTFHGLGIKQNVVTFRLENDYNIRDVEAAKNICKELGINLTIIDWNLQNWIENHAEDIYKKSYCPLLEKMIRFDWLNYLDNIPIFGEGEPYWRKTDQGWRFLWGEDDFIAGINGRNIGRTVIGEWYIYTPEIAMSFCKLPLIQRLINEQLPGKISSWSSRSKIHKLIWPTVDYKPKLVGYEGSSGEPFSRPQFMTEFYEQVVKGTNCRYFCYTEKDLDNLFS